MPQAAAYRNVTHAIPHRDEKCSSSTSFFDTFFQKNTLLQSNTAHVITNTLTNFARFTFTAKEPREGNRTPVNKIKYSEERDPETGFSYFGARYYDPDISALWLSVDPMADKYPGISPYAYCTWNPVIMVDPNGNDGRVVVSQINGKTSIMVSTTVFLKSDELNRMQLSSYAKNAQFEAKRLLKTQYFEKYNCEVSFDVQYKVFNGEELLPGDNLLSVNPSNLNISGVKGTNVSYCGLIVGGQAGSSGDINSDICSLVGASKGKGILHETMHFLGLSDRYNGDKCFKGFEKDIMGLYARNASRFDDSHYLPYIEKYGNADMGDEPYILLKEKIDVSQTRALIMRSSIE